MLRQETTVAEKFLGHFGDNQEHYVLARIEEHVPHIKNNTLLLIDSIPYSPVEHFQVFKLSQLLVKAGTLFQYKVYPRTAAMKVVQYHYYLSIEFFITQCLSSTGNWFVFNLRMINTRAFWKIVNEWNDAWCRSTHLVWKKVQEKEKKKIWWRLRGRRALD